MDSAGFHNAAVRAARLLHQKKHRLEQRCFLIEGPVLLQAAIDSGARIQRIFVSDEADLKNVATEVATATTRVDQRTLESLSQTKSPQGVVAVVEFLDHDANELAQFVPASGNALVLVLPNLSDPGNAGTLLRSAEAFGANAIVFGAHSVEPYNDKVVRASMGSLFRVPLVRYHEWRDLVAVLRGVELHIVAGDASGSDVRSITLPQRAALVIGQESHGLAGIPREDLETVVSLPQRQGVESLNAGVAGSLLLYEFARAQGLLGHAGTSSA